MPDLVLIGEKVFALLGVDGEKLFTPKDAGIERTKPTITSCYRGYTRWFSIKDDILRLDQININTDEEITINNKKSLEEDSDKFFQKRFTDLDFKMDFTGRILVADDFIDEMYIHLGFQRPYAFETVFELHFKKGTLVKKNNLSNQMARIRELDNISDDKLPKDLKKEISYWLKEHAKFDY